MVNEIQIKWLELRNLGTTQYNTGLYVRWVFYWKICYPTQIKQVWVYTNMFAYPWEFFFFFITDDPGCIIIINEVNVMYHLYTMVVAI